VEDEEADGATGLGSARAEVRAPRWTGVSAALMEGGEVLGAREQARMPFYRRLGWKREARRAGHRLEVATGEGG
jgi:hypothetical protein